MDWIVRNIDWLLIVSGIGTCGMLPMVIAPRWSMRFIFGQVGEGPVANFIARSWGTMITASGVMLIYAAYHPEARLPVLLYSIVGKMSFVILTAVMPAFHKQQAVGIAAGDFLIVVLLSWYLLAA